MSDKTRPVSSSPSTESLPVAHALQPGDVIMEYAVERTLGGGGFGITYLAHDVNLELPVAIKEYLPSDLALRAADNSVHPLGDAFKDQFEWGLERFLAEARVLATFRHPNIVRVLRYFMANGTAYIVMEYESGQSLKHWFPRQGGLTQLALLKVLFPLLDGLEVIHSADFLHRDIKPDNIYIRDDGTPVLIDFGSARSTNSDRELTNIVSPGFAPFEQYHSKGHQGPWTDIYSLAAVMYWLITGNKPQDSLSRLKQDTMVSTMEGGKGQFDEGVLRAIDWAINPDETKRPQNVAELRKRLLDALGETRTTPVAEITGRLPAYLDAGNTSAGGENSGRNLVCSILFTDIVAYSQESVNAQYEIKTLFNQLIADKVGHIPENSRITLDTGDGAAICFLGDPEEVLRASIEIQQALLAQDRLQVRMGLHIGPVRIISDLNGRDNVIGDGINVAQRVMSFADSNALVASRAFYEIVARLTDRSERSFKYLGERRDKHDRAHEIYTISTGNVVEDINDKTVLFSELSGDKTVLFNPAGDGANLDLELVAGGGAPTWKKVANHVKTRTPVAAAHAKQHALDFVSLVKVRTPVAIAWVKRHALAFSSWVKARTPEVVAWVKRIGLRARDAVRSGYAWSKENTYWWKLALATLAACGAGIFLGGAYWGFGAGAAAVILGGGNLVFRMKKSFVADVGGEGASQAAFADVLRSGQNVRTILIAILPSVAAVAFVLAVADMSGYSKRGDKPGIVEQFIGSVIHSSSIEYDAEARENLEKARKMLKDENYKAAIGLANAVLEKHPGNEQAQEILKEAKAAQKRHRSWLPF